MRRREDEQLWALVHAERAALAEDLAGLSPEQWREPSLCAGWTVEDVVAHLVAAASLTRWQWLRSMAGARLRPDLHNQRRLEEFRGADPAGTLARLRAVIGNTTAPSGHTPAYLGEVLVHAQDIRRPLGLLRTPSVDALTEVARFFSARNFAVDSRTAAAGLRLQADDGPFSAGTGPLVSGPTLALVMAMAGRCAYLEDLDGPGLPVLSGRIPGSH